MHRYQHRLPFRLRMPSRACTQICSIFLNLLYDHLPGSRTQQNGNDFLSSPIYTLFQPPQPPSPTMQALHPLLESLSSLAVPHKETLRAYGNIRPSWKMAFLVAIKSAHNFRKLSTLWIDVPFLTFYRDKVVLCTGPNFTPKIMSSFHINQDILLPAFFPFQPSSATLLESTLYLLNIPIIIPCHRVICSSGQTGKYTGGSHLKEWLLSHEKLLKEKLAY
ncbi:Methylated-DNA--protein-cysteine methyltransferase [Varanus komodoensis]|nr:Methylated-DNA--protein-cysteine methyltransferase [Varanus komodoensis]